MRVVLHIGMTKAGSTALQTGLAALRESLLSAGVLYPKSPLIRTKQSLLIVGLTTPDRLPRHLRHKYDGDLDDLGRKADVWLDRLAETIRTRSPELLLLSNEWLFDIQGADSLRVLARRLRWLGGPVEVVAYVRRPSDHYLSMAQQTLKASHELRQPGAIRYRAALSGYAEHVADTLRVVPYNRTAWPGGDILRHFLDLSMPGIELPLDEVQQRPNESLSAEAMSLLADYRRTFWPAANDRFTPDTARLVRALHAADRDIGGSRRPQLHEPIRRYVDQASTDLLSLRDEYGVTFDDVDYDTVGKPSARPAVRTVEGICPVDATRKAELALRALGHLAMDAG